MTEVIVAVYDTRRAAETAIGDLQTARVPTTRIVSDPTARAGLAESRKLGRRSGNNVVAVTVDECHASLVLSILQMQAPANMTEPTLNVA